MMELDEDAFWIKVEQTLALTKEAVDSVAFMEQRLIHNYEYGLSRNIKKLLMPILGGHFYKAPKKTVSVKAINFLLKSFGRDELLKLPTKAGQESLFIECFTDGLDEDIKCVEEHLITKSLTPNFVLSWSNVRAASVLMSFILEDLAPAEFDQAHQGKRVDHLKYWYVLWVDYLIKNHDSISSRKYADMHLGEILYEIYEGSREVPLCSFDEVELRENWAKKMLLTEDNKTTKYMGSLANTRMIPVKKFDEYLLKAKSLALSLPPVGEQHYHKK